MNKAIIFILSLTVLFACKEAKSVVIVENYSTTSEELLCYGDSLLQNKRGAIVAIDPSNGEILAMVSAGGKEPLHRSCVPAWNGVFSGERNNRYQRRSH